MSQKEKRGEREKGWRKNWKERGSKEEQGRERGERGRGREREERGGRGRERGEENSNKFPDAAELQLGML